MASIMAAIGAAKNAFEAGRAALGMAKDAKDLLPAGEKKEAVARNLEEAGKQLGVAEAGVWRALGYPLCHHAIPPTPMLLVGWREAVTDLDKTWLDRQSNGWAGFATVLPVYECPQCGWNNAGSVKWSRTRPALPGCNE